MSDSYKIWKPEHDGHAPPNWRDGMKWTRRGLNLKFDAQGHPEWLHGWEYRVEPEALNSPNGDARQEALKELTRLGEEADALEAISLVRKLPADFLAKHGITLAPEKDWATELWADLMDAWSYKSWAHGIRNGFIVDDDQKAIELLRTRFEQMKGEG